MSRFTCCVVWVMTSLAAGCATAPDDAAENRFSAEAAPAPSTGATADVVTDAALSAEASPALIVDAKNPALQSVTSCRLRLKGSNVIVKQCMSQTDWAKYDRREASEAQELVRLIQRGGLR